MPNRKAITNRITIAYILWWTQWTVLQVFVIYRIGFGWTISTCDSLVSNLLLMGVSFATSNVLRFYQPQRGKWYFGFMWNIGIAAICLSIFDWVMVHLFVTNAEYVAFIHRSIPVRFCFAMLMVTCSSMISWVWQQLMEQQDTLKRKSELEQLVKESELIKIRQQLQPHFLFNSLNSISALTGSKPEEARKMIQQLSDFLRGTLKKDDQQMVSLEEELKHLQLYLDIEKVRFGHRLNITIDATENARKMLLPALLLQPIVENAVKFGLYDTLGETTISIHAEEHAGHLVIHVENPYDPETAKPKLGTGFGLSSVERRLSLLFGRNDLLATKSEDHTFITFVKIPQANIQSFTTA